MPIIAIIVVIMAGDYGAWGFLPSGAARQASQGGSEEAASRQRRGGESAAKRRRVGSEKSAKRQRVGSKEGGSEGAASLQGGVRLYQLGLQGG